MFDWIVDIISAMGPVGVGIVMFLENVFPPISSELVMPLAGFIVAHEGGSLALILVAGTIGALAGAVLWYWIGRWLGEERLRVLAERYGRWFTMTPDEFDQATDWFRRHGTKAVLIGRMIPTVRTLISVPAGVSGMPFGPFLLYSAIGTFGWTLFLGLSGYILESQYERVQDWLNPVSTAVVIGIVGWYLWRVISYDHRIARKG